MDAGARRALVVGLACVVVAAVSVALLPAGSAYDPSAWLLWGRQVLGLELDTTGGPSWKPLPVLVTTVLAPAGNTATILWAVVARAAALAAVAGCAALARRLVGEGAGRSAGIVAAVVAGGLVVLTPDDHSRFTSLTLEAHTAPATAALAVWAIERHLAGRLGWAWGLLVALALDRPEAWPFLGLYGLWLLVRRSDDVRRSAGLRWEAVVGGWVAIPVLWFGGDLWGSGDVVHGAGVAAVFEDDPNRVADAVARLVPSVAAPTWALAATALVLGIRHRDRASAAVAGLAVAWVGVVVGMCAALGYASVGRFLLPAAALVCVLAGVGAGRLVALADGRWRAVAVAAVAVATVGWAWSRIDIVQVELDRVAERERTEEEVAEALAAAGGRDAVTDCGVVANDEGSPTRPGMAWMLGIRLDRSKLRLLEDQRGVVFDRRGTPTAEAFEATTDPDVRILARTDRWLVVAVGCDEEG